MSEKRDDETITAFTLRRIREDIIEECAKVAEDFPDSILQLVGRPGGPPGNYLRSINGRDIAGAIRRLRTAPSNPHE